MKPQDRYIETWLPQFPSFYNTEFEPNLEKEFNYIADIRADKGLNEIDDYDDHLEFDDDQWEQKIIEEYSREAFSQLNEILDTNMEVYVQGIKHPREYNFKNDSVDIKVYVHNEDLLKIQHFVYSHKKEFTKCLKDFYTPRDGFIPFYSNKFEDWEEKTGYFLNWEDCEHEFGRVLDFILDEQGNSIYITDIEIYESEFIENIEQLEMENICEECQQEFVETSYKEMYDKVVEHYTDSWNKMTGGQKIPGFYSLEDWLKKVNPGKTICAYCADDVELNKAM